VQTAASTGRKTIVPCDVAIKRFYRMYVEVDEEAGTDQVVAKARKILVESGDPDAELIPDPDLFSEIEERDICWVNPDWEGSWTEEDDENGQ